MPGWCQDLELLGLGLYRVLWGYMGIMEKKMETTIVCWGDVLFFLVVELGLTTRAEWHLQYQDVNRDTEDSENRRETTSSKMKPRPLTVTYTFMGS